MTSPRSVWLILALSTVAPRLAAACACCDAAALETPVGWSADGQKLLLTVSDQTRCQVLDYAMVLPLGAEKASVCHDLRGDPKKAIQCEDEAAFYDAVEDEPWGKPRAVAETGLTATFPTPAKPDKAHFRVKRARVPREAALEEANCVGNEGDCFTFTVEFHEGKSWRPIWSTVAVQGRKCPRGMKCEAMPAIRVYPSPAGGSLAIRTFDFDVESMMFMTAIEWVKITP